MMFGNTEVPESLITIGVGIILAVVGGAITWVAYLSRQQTHQAKLNATTAATLERVTMDLRALHDQHQDLRRDFYRHIDQTKDRRIEELEMELAEAKGMPS